MAFLPPVIYSIWIRNTEKYNREKWRSIFLCFLWGATISVLAAFILEFVLDFSLSPSINNQDYLNLFAIVIIAPVVEEFTKPLALRLKLIKREISEPEDGLIYGAVSGLGFSATENLLYGWSFMTEGLLIFFILITIRSIGACLLHASATAWTGYGYGKTIISGTSIVRVLPYFLFAIIIHALYNSLLTFDIFGITLGFIAAIALSLITIKIVRSKIKSLDKITN
jgi:RsiW-degrading membrane proteinase PrsW (M82 family)